MKLARLVPFLIALPLVTGCDDLTKVNTTATEAPNSHTYTSAITTARMDPLNYDEQAAIIQRNVPGFAGLYLRADTLVIRTVHSGYSLSEADVRARINGIQTPYEFSLVRTIQNLLEASPVVVKAADYSYEELLDWTRRLRMIAPSNAVVGFGVDQEANRIVVDLSESADSTRFKLVLAATEIPPDAIVLRFARGARPFVHLYDSIDPTVGGIAIEAQSQSSECSLGFNALASFDDEDHRVFFTADHCTAGYDSISDTMYQPTKGDAQTRILGTEVFSTAPSPSGCGTNCFDGDVAIVEYESNESYRRGAIPRGLSPTGTSASWDGTTIWEVISVVTSPIQGHPLHKVGITTGYTYGTVTQTCYTYTGGGIILNCLIEVTRPTGVAWSIAEVGDSGAPVFFRPYSNKVAAYGILFGGSGESGQTGVVRFWATPTGTAMNGAGMPGGTFDFTYNGLVE